MKNKKLHLVVSLAAVLLLASVMVVSAAPKRAITGAVNYPWVDGRGWLEINVHQTETGEVFGRVRYKALTSETNGWRKWDSTPICMSFDVYEGNPAASLVFQINDITPGGLGVPGQYIKIWVVDTGPQNDLVGMNVYPPVDDQPNCDYELPFFFLTAEHGNYVIQ
jgi:hypothetical protein